MSRFTDLEVEQDADGIFDLVIDEAAQDFMLADGLEAAIITSVFSDRRARADEVPDATKRRGWIGNLVSEVPGDNFGSGLWLYEQSRLTAATENGVRTEAQQALDWMTDEALISYSVAFTRADPVTRQVYLYIQLFEPSGDATERAYRLADATHTGRLATLGTAA